MGEKGKEEERGGGKRFSICRVGERKKWGRSKRMPGSMNTVRMTYKCTVHMYMHGPIQFHNTFNLQITYMYMYTCTAYSMWIDISLTCAMNSESLAADILSPDT